jgi:phage terminase large subunit-like protein
LDDWQRFDIATMLARRADGLWASYEHATVVSRQQGKGEVILVRQLAGLFLFDEDLILSSAHEFRTANEAFLRIVAVVENTPHLKAEVKSIRFANGEQGIELRTGQRLKFVARTRGGGRGMSADCVILDEAYELGDDQMAALLPTLSARPNPQIVYASSAGMVTSVQLHRLRKRAIDGERGRLCYLEWSASPDDDMTSPAVWERANPAMSSGRVTRETIEAEMRTMSPQAFARERLGVFDTEDGAGGEIPLDAWATLVDPASEIDGTPTIALDISPERDWASFAAVGRRADGLTHVEVIDRRPGTGWVVDRAAELALRWSVPIVVDPSSPAGALIDGLRAVGVTVDEVSRKDHAQACGQLVDAVRNDSLRHLGQPSLLAALTGAHKRQTGDVWLWSRTGSHVDITPLVAVTIALSATHRLVHAVTTHTTDVVVDLNDY